MTFADSIAADCQVWQDTQTVTYYAKTAEGVWAAGVAVQFVTREPTQRRETPGAALASEVTTYFDLPVSQLAGITPRVGDKLTDAAGVSWVVRSSGLETFDTVYRVECVKAR